MSRRKFVRSASLLTAGLAAPVSWFPKLLAASDVAQPLGEFGYGDVTLASELHERQLSETHAVLMGLSEDSLLQPFRQIGGQPAPGVELGGWYKYDPNYDWHTFDAGFAPAATFGQWVSALARTYAITGDRKIRDKVLRLNRLYAEAISGDFYEKTRFPAYSYDKLVCGLIDSHQLAGDPDAYRILEHTTDTAVPHLPGKAIEHGKSWRPGTDESYTWDESYTMPENLFLAYQRGAGDRYRALGIQYLNDEYFDPLAEGQCAFAGRHAYSHVNALCSAMQTYLTLGNVKYLRAAQNGFDMLAAQSFATGGWGPDEILRAPNSDDVYASLTKTHSSFETPCGSYAHFKLTRYLLRVTRDSRYGDSMERVMYNTVLGAKPLQADGKTFYYSDYNFKGQKVYSNHSWPCCSGTLPQVAADYRINTYFRDSRGIYVNLYIPSTLRWTQENANPSLTQTGSYPFDSLVQFEVTASRPVEFGVNFRIPSWAEGASISVNGKRALEPVIPGHFATLRRRWKTGDRVEVDLKLTKRLEPIDAQHPNTVALLCGPLVLFAITEAAPVVSRQQLLSAKKIGEQKWQVETATARLNMLPFTAIWDEQYSTYLIVQ
ncbi:MAG: glycoside hydrolase family 127 protein [Acidobacteriia bacterium]|nr:glycoside hydrolase family 127 protein [Terriglobia bacterium]